MLQHAQKIQALQYLFDVARTAPAAAAVHEQVAKYGQSLADTFQAEESDRLTRVPIARNPPKDLAEAVAQARSAAVPTVPDDVIEGEHGPGV